MLYFTQESKLSDSIANIYNFVNTQISGGNANATLSKNLSTISNYFKPYVGNLIRPHKIYKNERFYNEREWRYIPDIDFLAEPPFLLSAAEFNDEQIRSQANNKLKGYKLRFGPNDIKYIVVHTELEISHMIKALKRIKGRFGNDVVEILTSKILTSDQILHDF